jgi:hypothetical protein
MLTATTAILRRWRNRSNGAPLEREADENDAAVQCADQARPGCVLH